MNRWVASALAVVVLIATAVAILSYTQDEAPASGLVLTEIEGDVQVKGGDGKAEPVATGLVLDPKDVVTTGLASRAVLMIGTESRIYLKPQSTLEVKAQDESSVTVELEGGALSATVRPGPTALKIGSQGRDVVATDATFEMGVGDDGTLAVEVSDGAVAMSGVTGVSEVRKGDRATVSSDRAGVVTPVTADLLLNVAWPTAPTKTRDDIARVSGTTAPRATVTVRGGAKVVQVKADQDGKFEANVPLAEGDNSLSYEATDALGKVAQADGVVVELKTKGPGYTATTGGGLPR